LFVAPFVSADHALSPNGPLVRRLVNASQKRGLTEMGRQIPVVLYVVAMVAVIVAVDFLFFRQRLWERLLVNIGIVLVFAAFYLRYLRHP
jgi:protein-S-isoprenylcysteine O-methyltransferase Ste14